MRQYTIASIILLAAMLTCVGSAGATDWHVNAPESIQDAIDDAADGDTVIVHDGIYTEQLYITKSLDLRAADGENPEIWAPEPAMLENYDDFELMPELIKSFSATPIIMVNGSSGNVSANITGFVIDGSSVIPGTSEFGIDGILYLRADGKIEDNEVKNIWGKVERTAEGRFMWNGKGVFMFSDSSNDVTICRNNVHDYTGEDSFGIYVMGKGCRSAITENTVTGAGSSDFPDQTGIGVCNSATAKVTDNIISDCIYTEEWPWAAGITFTDANGTIQGNTVTGGGIWLNSGFFSAHSTISIRDNTVDASGVDETDCGPLVGVGVYLYEKLVPWYEGEPSVTATIEDNLLIGVSDISVPNVGISLTGDKNTSNGSVDAMITRNTISGWEHGIELFKQSNSMIYLNDFVDNQENAVIENSTNLCNSQAEMRYLYDGEEYTNYLGNYWSDYTGSDSDGDGIGDDPYTITGDNPDHYPLVEIYKNYRIAITPEELFKSLAGEWAFEESMILGNDTIPINGTRTFTLTGPSSADFVVAYKMGEAETTETGSAWWDGERNQLAIKEGDEMGYSNLTINGYESSR